MTTRRSRKIEDRPSIAIVYCRVSALESQSESDASLEQQQRTLTAAAELTGYTVRLVIERHSASKAQPELEAALDSLARGEAAALYVAKVDRLTRKGAADVIRIADRADKQGWRLVLAELALDTATPAGRLVLTVLAGIAEFESKRRSERMREYHAARRARGEQAGVTYGQRRTVPASVRGRIKAARNVGQTFQVIASELNSDGIPSATGKQWSPVTVRRVALAA
jgi:DNA invertase Pin-like site-specific DNA recombinase